MTITPGDTMTASVTTDGAGDFTLTLIDDTTGVSKTVSAHSAARGYSAEVIAEAPTDATTGTQYPLADFGTANFSNCTIDGEPIADSAWRQIDMVDESSDTLGDAHDPWHGRCQLLGCLRCDAAARAGAQLADAVPGHDGLSLLPRCSLR